MPTCVETLAAALASNTATRDAAKASAAATRDAAIAANTQAMIDTIDSGTCDTICMNWAVLNCIDANAAAETTYQAACAAADAAWTAANSAAYKAFANCVASVRQIAQPFME